MQNAFRSRSAEAGASGFYQENIDVTGIICGTILENDAPVSPMLWAYGKSGIFCFDGKNITKYNRIGEYCNCTNSTEDNFEIGTYFPVKSLGISENYYIYYPEKDWATFCITIATDKNNNPMPDYTSFIISETGNEERETLTIITNEMIQNYLN